MKFLLLFFIFMVLLWQWRHAREQKVSQAARKNTPPTGVVDMVECAHCGVHLPANETVQGANSVYCSEAHRKAREH